MLQLLHRLIRVLAIVNEPVARWGRNIAAALIGLMLLVAVAQILTRATFSYSLDWAEEVARFSLVWTVLLVAPYAYRSGGHVAIDSFASALPLRLLTILSALINALVIWICAVMLTESFAFWRRGLTMLSASLQIHMSWVYAIVPLAFFFMIVIGIELVLRLLCSLARPDPRLRMAGAVPGVLPDVLSNVTPE